ncbi:RNB domain-containing ribonuclease [Myxococcota bacterium]|nr:RNB domain-containing ribonuclease [Myxococcota bacterium]
MSAPSGPRRDGDRREGTVEARLLGVLRTFGLDPAFPAAVEREVEALLRTPGIDDPRLEDWTHLPFITIDNVGSRDLDQAMCLAHGPRGDHVVHYALADGAHYVRPGSAIWETARQRGVTYYLPGLAMPMLHPALSEGLVSLNEGVDRRALVMTMTVDPRGQCTALTLTRARIRSRAKLTYDEVQTYYDHPEGHRLAGQPYTETLELLRVVGQLRIDDAVARDIAQPHRSENRYGIDPDDPSRFSAERRRRLDSERYNEQISLLANIEGGAFLERPGLAPHIAPIYRVHPEPMSRAVAEYRALVREVITARGLDRETWDWHRERKESIADYLARLPDEGDAARLRRALHRQALMINRRSEFRPEPGLHHGVGADPYARFTSPMRELVGIVTHRDAIEKLTGDPPEGWPEYAGLDGRLELVELANHTSELQKLVEKAAAKLVLDQFVGDELDRPLEARAIWRGTLLGLTPTKAYVEVESPPFELKLYLSDLAARHGVTLDVSATGGVAHSSAPERFPSLVLGDALALRLEAHDPSRDRYVFAPVGFNV